MNGPAAFDVVQQRLGLGCARLGSVLGRDRANAFTLIQAAYDRGIRFFDTANIYGQGESERILGAALGSRRKRVTLVTKAGQYFPAWMRIAKPLKSTVAPLIRRSGAGRHLISKAREAPLPQNFSDHGLRASIDASLRRLNTDYADILLLHSPPADVIARGDALGLLDKMRDAGKAIKIGISCEDVQTGLLALDDPRVDAVELPLWPPTEMTDRFLDRARRQAVFVIGRGLINTAQPASSNDRWSAAQAALTASLARSEISRVLIGTTRLAHLDQVLDAVRRAETSCS
ncbi:aldo/keto reductase [Bradyrhizobium sp. HKCCYLS1011]|uniref:aldo/keto reductase n=1 Tax=Bradyrhizobium sp. HKCCYLS1011 TaxID=3420733 RepID=UPI003EB7D5FA